MSAFTPPSSYGHVPGFSQIKLSHHPPTSQEVTPIIILTLSRVEKNNAFTSTMENDMVRAFDMLDQDDRVKVIVVTGEGKNFCAGADLEIGLERTAGIGPKDHRDGGGRTALAIHRCRKPTIAAIQGAAIGVGITMTLPMSIRVAWEGAKIGFVFSQRGVVMEAASSFFLPRLIGHSRAIYLTTTGSVIPAASPAFEDLFHAILPSPEEVLPYALTIAEQIAAQTSTVSTYLMREMIWRNPGSAEGAHLLDSEIMWELYGKEDKKEGVKAFLEKRSPKMTGDLKQGMPSNVPWWEPINTVPRSGIRSDKSKL
ncbi:ClpP/crotonase [Mollisia scopiformis]|uniref:ClpP/crotonase n=1 Tax=Mollisia scopiformis TaxID=149040 RepID=A0A132B3E0_MOLSC|nr:ClpP/crotonase [Mollisia scopiformis]KUJ06851.1 ClpP/crotonase [Mollisia scopiformis]